MSLVNEYNKEASTYDQTRFDTYDGKIIDKAEKALIWFEFEKIWTNQKHVSQIKILEVGCGTGRFLKTLYAFSPSFYVKLHGIDPSKEMRKIAKSNVPTARIIKGTIEKIPFKSGMFDLVFCMHVFMHLKDTRKGIDEMYRVLKRDGILVADFPNKWSPWTVASIILNPFKKRTRLFTITQLIRELDKYKIEIGGLFSYSRIFYKIPVIRDIILWLETNLPLPVPLMRQIIIKIKKV